MVTTHYYRIHTSRLLAWMTRKTKQVQNTHNRPQHRRLIYIIFLATTDDHKAWESSNARQQLHVCSTTQCINISTITTEINNKIDNDAAVTNWRDNCLQLIN